MSQVLYDVTQNSQIQIITFFDPVENRVKFHYVDQKFSEHIGYLDLFGQFRKTVHKVDFNKMQQISMDRLHVSLKILENVQKCCMGIEFYNSDFGSCGMYTIRNSEKLIQSLQTRIAKVLSGNLFKFSIIHLHNCNLDHGPFLKVFYKAGSKNVLVELHKHLLIGIPQNKCYTPVLKISEGFNCRFNQRNVEHLFLKSADFFQTLSVAISKTLIASFIGLTD